METREIEQIIKEMRDRKAKRMQEFNEMLPPENIWKMMQDEIKNIDKVNGGKVDKSTLWLGMTSMWMMLDKHECLNKEIITQIKSN